MYFLIFSAKTNAKIALRLIKGFLELPFKEDKYSLTSVFYSLKYVFFSWIVHKVVSTLNE